MCKVKELLWIVLSTFLLIIQLFLLLASRLPFIGRPFMMLYIKCNMLGWDIYDRCREKE
nr:MAG TPA: hypothetical protein [Caudoviricetes sp.]